MNRPFPYDPRWPVMFAEEAAILREALAPWLVEDIHHVGSTSIPGMFAKPVIDMVAGVGDLDDAREAFGELGRLDYAYREHRRDAHSFFKPPDAPTQWEETHHLHLTVPGSALWRERLAFRDALRRDPELVREYSDWKLKHYGKGGGGSKRPFVSRVLAMQGIPLLPDAERLTEAAFEARSRPSQ